MYLRVRRYALFDAAIELLMRSNVEVLPLEAEDVLLARQLHERHPDLSARDLCHLATCQTPRHNRVDDLRRESLHRVLCVISACPPTRTSGATARNWLQEHQKPCSRSRNIRSNNSG